MQAYYAAFFGPFCLIKTLLLPSTVTRKPESVQARAW